MKNTRFLLFILTIATLVLSACGAAATPSAGSGKVEAIPVAFVGTVEGMAGDQWVINGTTVTVVPTVVRDGPFNVGDQVKVEGIVNPDGSLTVSRVEVASPEDVTTLPQFGDDNSNDANTNDDNGNGMNSNDDNGNDANMNDDNGNDVDINDDNSNAANSNDANVNDDNGNGMNSNDDNGNDANMNDDNGNDDNSNASGGTNDDSGGGKGGGNDDGGGGNGGGGGDDDDGNSNDD